MMLTTRLFSARKAISSAINSGFLRTAREVHNAAQYPETVEVVPIPLVLQDIIRQKVTEPAKKFWRYKQLVESGNHVRWKDPSMDKRDFLSDTTPVEKMQAIINTLEKEGHLSDPDVQRFMTASNAFLLGKKPVLLFTGMPIVGMRFSPGDSLDRLRDNPSFFATAMLSTVLGRGHLKYSIYQPPTLIVLRDKENEKSAFHQGGTRWHNDGSNQEYMPDIQILACINGEPGVKTRFVSANELVRMLPEDAVNELCTDTFSRISDIEEYDMGYKYSILTKKPDGDYSIKFAQRDGIIPSSQRGAEALEALETLLKQLASQPGSTLEIELEPGDVILNQNTIVIPNNFRMI